LSVNGSSTLRFTNIYDKGTYTPFNVGIGEQSILNVGAYLRGGTVMLFPDSNLVSSSANLFLANSNVLGVEFSAFGSGLRNYSKQGGDNKRNSLALYTSDISQQNTNRLYINYNGDIGINDDSPSFKLDVNGTLGVTGAATLSSTLAVTGAITEAGNNVMTNLDTVSLSNRINGKVGLIGNESISGTKTFNNLVNITNQMTLSGSVEGLNKLIGKNSSNDYLGDITLGAGLSITSNVLNATQVDTTSLSNRINGKVSLTGNETISGDKTFTNKIILNDSSRFESDVLFKKNFGLPIVKISNANYTATTANHTIIYTTLTSDKTLTIPNASDAVGIKYTISIFDTPEGNEALTIVTPSNNSFVITDGEGASVGIVGGYCTVLQSDGIKWYVLSYSPMY
jgi:hypothetical protein